MDLDWLPAVPLTVFLIGFAAVGFAAFPLTPLRFTAQRQVVGVSGIVTAVVGIAGFIVTLVLLGVGVI